MPKKCQQGSQVPAWGPEPPHGIMSSPVCSAGIFPVLIAYNRVLTMAQDSFFFQFPLLLPLIGRVAFATVHLAAVRTRVCCTECSHLAQRDVMYRHA